MNLREHYGGEAICGLLRLFFIGRETLWQNQGYRTKSVAVNADGTS